MALQQHLVIIGNGISGVTCARHVRKRDSKIRITLISSKSEFFFSRTALMYVYMGHMKQAHTQPYEAHFWTKNRIELLHKKVKTVHPKTKSIILEGGDVLPYDKLVIACGSASNKMDLPGKELKGVQGLYSLQDLEQMEEDTKLVEQAVVVGGGLIGVELAEMLRSRDIGVKMLVRDTLFWDSVLPAEEARMVGQHLAEHGVDLRLETELKSMHDDGGDGRLHHVITKSGEKLPAQFAGIAVGVHANIEWLKDSGIETEKGILVDEHLSTSAPDIWAIGDCAQYRNPPAGRKPQEQVWYTGRMHGETVAVTICGNKQPYAPGPWFNSAKFFDIEYQSYGTMPAKKEEGTDTFYWEEPRRRRAIRAAFQVGSKTLTGLHSLGIRLRHEVVARWLTEARTLDYVMTHLADALFDEEFHHSPLKAITGSYAEKYSVLIKPAGKSWKRILGLQA